MTDRIDEVAAAIAQAADADYWVDEIKYWETVMEDWERESQPQEYPLTAYEDREWYRKQALAAIESMNRDKE